MKLSQKAKFFFVVTVIVLAVSSCSKEEGTGGLATIKGKVYAYDYNSFGMLVDSGYIADEKIYISYGEHTSVDDNINSSYDGSYAFEWLQKGDYTVWAYSKCDTCTLGVTAVKVKVHISSRKETVTVPDLVINI